jgi:hypothetical protein
MMETRVPGAESGLAWGVSDDIGGYKGPVLVHAGSDSNWFALALLFPQTQNGILVAANAAEDMGADKAAKAVVRAILPQLASPWPSSNAAVPK